jgi:hypothetical protein
MSPRTPDPPQDPRRLADTQISLDIGRGWYTGWAWQVGAGGRQALPVLRGWADDHDVAIEQAVEALEALLPHWRPL